MKVSGRYPSWNSRALSAEISDMKRFSMLIIIAAIVEGVTAGGISNRATAEDFRVDNAVFVEGEKTPVSESTTIFYKGNVYDSMKDPAETVVFEKLVSKFTLLNLQHRAKAELTIGELTAFIKQLQYDGVSNIKKLQPDGVSKTPDPLVKFLSSPRFEERFDESAGELTLSSPLISYRLRLLPESDPTIVEQYHEFSDGYAQLNAMLSPGSRPPFGRLMVNAALAKRQSMASQVVLTFTQGKEANRQQITVRSTHGVVRPLTSADLQAVAKTREDMGSFKLISFEQYRKIGQR
jgi:hypothetical protein